MTTALRPDERGEWPILWSKGPKDPPRRAVRTLWRATLTTTLVAVRAPRVLVAYDGTDKAEIALEAVASLGWPAGTCIRVVAVRDDHLRLLRPLVDEQPFVELEETLMWAANHLAADLPRSVAIERRLLRGAALPAIVAEAEELGADLVVLGSRNRGPMRSAIFGSVGRDLVARADRPVLIARGDRLDRVLLAHDGEAVLGRPRAAGLRDRPDPHRRGARRDESHRPGLRGRAWSRLAAARRSRRRPRAADALLAARRARERAGRAHPRGGRPLGLVPRA